ncbi:MAG: DUF1080 domain-containing protein [Verrucomicrobiales bacterium]|nr:DUF1080 domain-containing protein [Verrucomicrobiales bacterium]
MKTTPLIALFALCTASLPAQEPKAAFEVLFDGSSFNGWKQSGNWVIEDGAMFRKAKGGGISYQAKPVPDDFELQFEWKVGKGSNSGVYYRPGQYEYQILDNSAHADGHNPRTSAASLYFCMQPSRDATKPVGEWNSARIVCKGTVIQHWLNGEKVVGFDYTDPKHAFNVEMLAKRGGDVAARGAFLSFQDHGDPVWFRNVRLRTLGPDEELDRSAVTPAEISPEVLAAEKAKLDGILKRREDAAAKAKAKKN